MKPWRTVQVRTAVDVSVLQLLGGGLGRLCTVPEQYWGRPWVFHLDQ